MSNLVQELYDLEGLLEKYAEALSRRIHFNRAEVDGISTTLQSGLIRQQGNIDYRIAFINKKLVRLRRKMEAIESCLKKSLQEAEDADQPTSAREMA